MRGLSEEIKTALDITIEGLQYKIDLSLVDEDKMRKATESKISSFASAKKLLKKWIESPNSPNPSTLKKYVKSIISAGDEAIVTLREALTTNIDFKELDAAKHDSAIKAKPIILEAIFELDDALRDLREQLSNDNLSFEEVEFKLGYPERFAKGEFMDVKQLFKNPLDGDKVLICPHGTKGKEIILSDLPIILPKPPKDKKEILFHDLPKKDQYWRVQEAPPITTDNVDHFVDYLKQEFKRRVEGVWFMNNGVETYLTPHHYFYLQYFVMLDDGMKPDFRIAQLHMFYHIQACLVDPRCLGQLFGKSRRTGFTFVSLAILLNASTMTRNIKCGMMSKTEKDGGEAFMKYAYALRSLPFYFRPIIKGKEDSTSHFEFSAPADSSKDAKKQKKGNVNDYLNTMVDYRATADGSYDSIKLNLYLLDELFKFLKPNNVITHLGMVRPTMMPSGRVVGKMLAGSTMNPHNKGGAEGIELIESSQVKDRDPATGKTATGLYFHFLPAQENMDLFTDKYGVCHVEKPKTKTYNVLGDEIKGGSLEYLLAIEAQLKKQSDIAYNEQLRTYPRTVEHLMRDEASNCVFNLEKIVAQIEYNNTLRQEELYTVGDFDWVAEEDGDVAFFPNPKGRFKVAWMPSKADGTEGLANRVQQIGDRYYPLNKNMVFFGIDPYSAKSTHGRSSNGAIIGKTGMNPEGGAPSNQIVLEYIARPQDENIFFEDVIKMMRYYGSPALVESNRIDLLRYIRNRGYRPFALERLDRTKDQLNSHEKEYAGQTLSSKDILDSHLNVIANYIQLYVGESTNPEIRPEGEMGTMPFNETLIECSKFDPDKRTKFDAVVALGLACMSSNPERYKGKQKERKVKSAIFVKKYNNSGSIGSLIRKSN